MRKLDCLLINPGNRLSVYQGLGAAFSAVEPPSLAALFAGYLLNKGRSVEILDAHALALDGPAVAELYETYAPTLVVLVVYGFQPSASTQNMPAAGAIARAIKERYPQAKIMMTGTHPAALPERTLAEEAVDCVCSGEGPDAIRQAIAFLDAEIPLPPIIRGENVANLDGEMSGCAWDRLPMDQYRAHNWHCFGHLAERGPYASIHTTLGCPYRCTFCCINAPFGGPSYRRWSPRAVGDELELLVMGYGVRNVKFVDEMFVLHRNHVLGVCDEIINRGLGESLNIWAYARVDTVKDEYLERLRLAGFRWLALGIESASKHVRDGAEKGRFGNEDILKVVKKVQDAGISVIGNYIFGLPDDTHDSMEETLSLAIEANCEFANFYSAMAYPGSKLYEMAKAKGWPLPDDPGGPGWIGYSQHAYETLPLPTEQLSAAEVLGFRDRAFLRYFSAPSYLSMIEKKFGYDERAHLVLMTQQELKRKIIS
jgi:radical SAM superfamily enzyme YgiQ (UPF0313 family)